MLHRIAAVANLALMVSSMLGHGQTPANVLVPAFEVASVKPTDPNERELCGMYVSAGGRLRVTNCTLKALIQVAYREDMPLQDFQILGGPGWVRERGYDLAALPPPESKMRMINPSNPKLPPPKEELQMLQTLLAERFALKMHEETKDGPVYELVLSEKPPRFVKAKDPDAFPVVLYGKTAVSDRLDFMEGINASMAQFAARLAGFMDRTVVDRTELTGTFDFKFEFAQIDQVSAGPSLPTALQELGLKLIPAKGPIRYLIIDQAEGPQAN